MNLGTEDYDWFSVMLDSMGQDKGLAFMRGLAKQELHMPGASSRMRVQLMLAGESGISLAARGRRVVEFKAQGAPIDFRIFEPYAGEPNSLSIAARPPHPHAAILFADWILSQEGQTRLAEIPRLSIRKGIKQRGSLQDLFVKEFTFVNPGILRRQYQTAHRPIQSNFRYPLLTDERRLEERTMLVDIKHPDPVPVDLDAKKTLLVIVDMENCSAHPNGPQYMGEPVDKIIPRIARLRDYVRASGGKV
jgi:hypothetical protein